MVTLQTLLRLTVAEMLDPTLGHLELVRHILLQNPIALVVNIGHVEIRTHTETLGLPFAIKVPCFNSAIINLGRSYPAKRIKRGSSKLESLLAIIGQSR